MTLVVTLYGVLEDSEAFNFERVHRMANDPSGFRYSDHSSCLFVCLLGTRPSALDSCGYVFCVCYMSGSENCVDLECNS